MRNVADMGLQIMYTLLQNIANQPDEIAQSFYSTYFLDILQHIFSVVTDTSHTASLSMHATILSYLFTIVEMGKVSVPLGNSENNVLVVQNYVAELLKHAFGHLNENQIKVMVTGMFTLNQDVSAFKEHLRDFLVQIRVSYC
jgi:exportin-1